MYYVEKSIRFRGKSGLNSTVEPSRFDIGRHKGPYEIRARRRLLFWVFIQ